MIVVATLLTGCGENKQERARRETDEQNRRALLEMQRQENIQRQADRDQRAVETGVKVLDILTR
jgi:F0F1-type ATP synthase beta subunit